MVDGDARSFHFRRFRNAKDATMSKEAESAVFFHKRAGRWLECGHDASSMLTICRAERPSYVLMLGS